MERLKNDFLEELFAGMITRVHKCFDFDILDYTDLDLVTDLEMLCFGDLNSTVHYILPQKDKDETRELVAA
jgi:hypothetical protein